MNEKHVATYLINAKPTAYIFAFKKERCFVVFVLLLGEGRSADGTTRVHCCTSQSRPYERRIIICKSGIRESPGDAKGWGEEKF
jgi:hypothetical protein